MRETNCSPRALAGPDGNAGTSRGRNTILHLTRHRLRSGGFPATPGRGCFGTITWRAEESASLQLPTSERAEDVTLSLERPCILPSQMRFEERLVVAYERRVGTNEGIHRVIMYFHGFAVRLRVENGRLHRLPLSRGFTHSWLLGTVDGAFRCMTREQLDSAIQNREISRSMQSCSTSKSSPPILRRREVESEREAKTPIVQSMRSP